MDNFEIKKIDLDQKNYNKETIKKSVVKNNSPVVTMNRKQRKINKKPLIIASAILLVIIVISFFAIFLPAKNVYGKLKKAMTVGRETAEVLKKQDIGQALDKLKETESALVDVQKSYKALGWVKFVPIVGGYVKDGEHGLTAGIELTRAGQVAVEEVTPYADLLGLSGVKNATFVNQPADKRIETAITTFSKVTPKLSVISEHLSIVKNEIDQIDPSRYPAKIGKTEIRSKIANGKEMADQTIGFFINAKPLLEVLPELVGVPDKKRYLFLFQNDKELRATGGFISAYAILSFNKGKMTIEKSDDIYTLDDQLKKRIAAPEKILQFHKGVSYFYLRDSNLSPDFAESMKTFTDLYSNTGSNLKKEVDGIFAVDTHVLVSMMKVLDGEIFVPEYNTKFTVSPDNRCDGCPQVIYELESYVDKPVGYFKGQRKDILGRLLYYLMQKALGISPSRYWGKLSQVFLEEINDKHILAYMFDEKKQNAFEALNFAGRIKEYDGDYLHINDTNFAGAKSNMFVKHYVNENIEIDKSGKVIKTVTIDYKNPSPASNCGIGGLCLNGVLRNWLRVYVPKGSKLLEFKGSETKTVNYEDLGKTVFEGFLKVNPMGTAQVTLKYELPLKLTGNEYKGLIQKQPGTEGHEYTIKINGREMEKFNLTTDKELKYKI